ncbi:hypothetical protein CONPUDRAFT_161395 [Coniophora puteana RWD-64-598 SS2]|uniref:Uncharacterized protein n=1 Tax=Coniophora puteana (strain RWD-64-598) TaxID=741705 RepID=A0A5M3N685_CONPW|nr:uncharacterized protein CONPUDRAFT_161395 [Coniophora puteana RWD-64-598 SS2]EIW86717.1 hypothetical protein CONPUDRAFT_161395 [Coniophora puteana RWD-64-598 SS2]
MLAPDEVVKQVIARDVPNTAIRVPCWRKGIVIIEVDHYADFSTISIKRTKATNVLPVGQSHHGDDGGDDDEQGGDNGGNGGSQDRGPRDDDEDGGDEDGHDGQSQRTVQGSQDSSRPSSAMDGPSSPAHMCTPIGTLVLRAPEIPPTSMMPGFPGSYPPAPPPTPTSSMPEPLQEAIVMLLGALLLYVELLKAWGQGRKN